MGRLTCGRLEESLDSYVEAAGDFESSKITILRQITGHQIVAEVDSIRALVDENGDGGVRACVGDVLCHLQHDERIANDEAEDAQSVGHLRLFEKLAVVEAGGEEKTPGGGGGPNYLF